MTDARIALVVEFRAAPGTREDLRNELLALVGPTRSEQGCLRYDLHVDPEDPDVLAFYEVWADADAHAAHDRTAHVAHIRSVLPSLTTGPPRRLRLAPIEPEA
jgi:quinol monooxygenase YgiN